MKTTLVGRVTRCWAAAFLLPAATLTAQPKEVSAAKSSVTVTPASVPADGRTSATIMVVLRDASGSAVSGKSVRLGVVNSSLGPNNSAMLSAPSGVSTPAGVVKFTVASNYDGKVSYVAQDVSDRFLDLGTVMVTFNGTNRAASTVAANPADVPPDGASTATIAVTLKDINSKPLPGRTVSLDVVDSSFSSGLSSAVTLSAASGPSDPSGLVTFTVKASRDGWITYMANDVTQPGHSIAVGSAQVRFRSPRVDAQQSTVVASRPIVPADGTATATVTVTLKDRAGQPVPGKTVWLMSPVFLHAIISAPSGPSDANGVVTFTVHAARAGTAELQATDHTDTIPLAQIVRVMFSGVDAQQSTVVASPSTVPANGTSTATVTVTLKDAGGHPMPGKTVRLSSPVFVHAIISAASGPSDAAGVVTFTVHAAVAGTAELHASDATDGISLVQIARVVFGS